MYHYQDTDRPYSGFTPDYAWSTVSKHRTLRAAVKAYLRGKRAMRKRCGSPVLVGLQPHHYRPRRRDRAILYD